MPTKPKENGKSKSTKKATTVASKNKIAKDDIKQPVITKETTKTKVPERKRKTASKSSKVVTNLVEYYDLPSKYNKTIVEVLFQTPKKLFVYWEIAEADKEKFLNENGKDFFQNSTPFLVVKNHTKNYSFEVEINDYANSWYFDIPDSNCEYSVELIRKNKQSLKVTQIQASNELEVPNNHILFEQNRHEIFFKNVKTNIVTSKNVANLQFINHVGIAQLVTLNSFYNKFYDEKDLYVACNPSSHS